MYRRLVGSTSDPNIVCVSLLVAMLFNIDKIVLGPFASIRVSDAFNVTYPFLNIYIDNILRFGLVSQAPEWLCGVSNGIYSPLLSYVLSGLVLPPYLNYLLNAIIGKFIAFSGMFLLLRDGFMSGSKAALIGALFFVSIPTYFSEFNTVAGIPLLFWALDRLLDTNTYFRNKIFCYCYIVFYFASSIFIDVSFVIVPFYFSYFFFVADSDKTLKNICILLCVFSLYLLIYLPSLSELYFHSQTSHRASWFVTRDITWIEALKYFTSMLFYINMTDGATYAMPSLLGLCLVIFLTISPRDAEMGRYFNFIVVWLLFVLLFAYFMVETPFWYYLKDVFGVLKSFSFKRFHYITIILYAILIGLSCKRLFESSLRSNIRYLLVSVLLTLFYVVCGLELKDKNVLFAPEHWLFVVKSQLFLQVGSLIIFFILISFALYRRNDTVPFIFLLVPFIVFALLNDIHFRNWWGNVSYHTYFSSNQIAQIRDTERNNLDKFRVVGLNNVDPAQLLNYGFSCADGYYALYPQSYKEFWSSVISPALKNNKDIQDLFLGSGNYVYLYDSVVNGRLNFNLELLKLVGVKYLVSQIAIPEPDRYGLIEAAKPETIDAGGKWKSRFKESQLYIYRTTEFADPVFLTDSMKIFDGKRDLLNDMEKRGYGYLRKTTYVVGDEIGDAGAEATRLDISDSGIDKLEITPDSVGISISNRHPVILNWSRNFNSNWRCWIDGKETRPFRIYNSFIGVIVPEKSHSVEFKYINNQYKAACILSASGFTLVSIVILMFAKKTSGRCG